MGELLDDFDPADEANTWRVSREELEALVEEAIEWAHEPNYRSKARPYRPWGFDPVWKVPLDGQVNKNLPLRSSFPVRPPARPRFINSPMQRIVTQLPNFARTTVCAQPTPPALKRALWKWRGPWKTRRSN